MNTTPATAVFFEEAQEQCATLEALLLELNKNPHDDDALGAMFRDNVKARQLGPDGAYRRRKPTRGEEAFRVQQHLYEDARAGQTRAGVAPVTFVPRTRPVERT